MLKRYFSIINTLSKQKNLESTIKFISKRSKPTISSIFQISSGYDKVINNTVHVDEIVSLLNNGLPNIDNQKEGVEAKYDILINRLRDMVDNPISLIKVTVNTRIENCKCNEDFFRLLKELELYGTTSSRIYYQIIMNPKFDNFEKLINSIHRFKNSLNLSLILCYRLKCINFYTNWKNEWINNFSKLSILSQKLFWKLSYSMDGMDNILTYISRISWSAKEVIILHQVLFKKAHELPDKLITRNFLNDDQILFCKILKILSRFREIDNQCDKWCGILIRSSVENKISHEVMTESKATSNVSIYQYRFIKSMESLTTQIIEGTTDKNLRELMTDIQQILNKEKQEMQDQTVLRFI